LAGCGISGNFRHDPGYAEFGAYGDLPAHREIGLSFGPLPLALARLAVGDDPEAGAILRDLRAVRVYVYDAVHDAEGVERQVRAVRAGLLSAGWSALATVRDGDENVAVLLRPDSDGVGNLGLAVIVQGEDEVVLVNLIGNVRLDQFAEYMTQLEVDVPGIDIDPRQFDVDVL
jgi:hypothetical protein